MRRYALEYGSTHQKTTTPICARGARGKRG